MARTKPPITDPNPPKSRRTNRIPKSNNPVVNNHAINYNEIAYAQRPEELHELNYSVEEISKNDPELLALLCDQYEHELEERKGKPGNPTSYHPKISPRVAYILASQHGFSDEMIAEVFCMSVVGLHHWSRKYPEFQKALWDGRMNFDCKNAVKGITKRAAGYFLRDRKWQRVPIFKYEHDMMGKPHQVIIGYEMAVTEETVKHLPPELSAAQYLLENRQPHLWKNRNQVEVNFKGAMIHTHLGLNNTPLVELDPTNLPDEALDQILNITGNKDPMRDREEEIQDAEYKEL